MKNYSDAEFNQSMKGAVRLGIILAALGAMAFGIWKGGEAALMFLVGSLISITGVWEWRRLMTAVALQMDADAPGAATSAAPEIGSDGPRDVTTNAAFDRSATGKEALQPVHSAEDKEGALTPEPHLIQKPRMGLVLGVFFLRLGLTVVVLYVTLKYLRGSALALAAGLMVGVFALTAQALRLLRSWSA